MNISGILKCVVKYFKEKAIMPWMREFQIKIKIKLIIQEILSNTTDVSGV